MTSFRQLKRITIVLWILLFFNTFAAADVIADLKYLETEISSDNWQYDYTFANASDPLMCVGFNLFKVKFELDPSVQLLGSIVPSGWQLIVGVGFLDIFSTLTGVPPSGTDIAPADSINGFVFLFDQRAAELPYIAFFTNPDDESNPLTDSGTTTPVPAPASILLLASGLLGMRVIGRKKILKK